jgi:peptidoglycan/xylan/chitin deacetylase (PgdA/CDA1 family)
MGMHRFGAIFISAALAVAGGGVMIMAGTLLSVAPAHAQSCPGNPDAIGTSRVLTLQPGEVARVGRLQYPDTLPLADHEVVLTFDDGPLPPYSNKILDILASQCVKATYFLVGEMAQSFPATVRRIHQEGHAIGTHSQDHPVRFDKLSVEKMQWEIDQGIANVAAALGDPSEVAPFFRIPGLGRTDTVESELAARSLVVFSVDAVADDWHRRIKPDQIISRAISRLEARGKGMLLLHDIHPATVAALPGLLKELKQHGFRIVQVVPGAPAAPAASPMIAGLPDLTVAWTTPAQAVIADSSAAPDWPQPDGRAPPDDVALVAPDVDAFDIDYSLAPKVSTAEIEAGAQPAGARDDATLWPSQSLAALPSDGPQLPAPSVQDIALPVAPSQVVGRPAESSPSHDAVRAADNARHHRHRHARARAGEGQRADASSGRRAIAALSTPVR